MKRKVFALGRAVNESVPGRTMKKRKGATKKGRGGRPQLDEEDRRSLRVGVPLNQEEMLIISEKARTYHMSKAFFLRKLGIGHRMRRPIPAINFQAHQSLGHLAGSLNQLIVLLREGKAAGVSQKSAEKLLGLLQSTRRALLTAQDDDRKD